MRLHKQRVCKDQKRANTGGSGQRLGFDTAKNHRLLNHQPLLGGARLASKGASIQARLASPAAGAEPIRWAAKRDRFPSIVTFG